MLVIAAIVALRGRTAKPSVDLAVTDLSFATVGVALGIIDILVGLYLGLYLILIGAGILAFGLGGGSARRARSGGRGRFVDAR